jgi:hypothetical protein
MGLGGGSPVGAGALSLPFSLERIVSEDGVKLLSTPVSHSRPFNESDLSQMNRADSCTGCHKEAWPDLWEYVRETMGTAETNSIHKIFIQKIFEKGIKKEK